MTAQTWRADDYARHADFVPALGQDVLDLLAPRPGERILDLGCGDGTLTARLVEAGASVLGVDASEAMLAAARAKGLDVRVMDGHALELGERFDAVFSNAALHWMKRPNAVIAGVARALRPGGRFVGEFGGHGNVAAIRTALAAVLARAGLSAEERSPWFFPSAEAYRARLEAAGFTVLDIRLVPRPTPLPTDMAGWLTTFGDAVFTGLAADRVAGIKEEVLDLLRPILADERGRWTADYVRLRFHAILDRPAEARHA